MSSELNSSELHELANTFLRGTARAALPDPGSGPLGAALQAVQRAAPEETLLARAALSGLYAQAGRVPAEVQTPAPVFVPQETDERPEVPEALLALLPALTQRPAVLHQTLGLMAAANLKLTAPQALPLLALQDGGNDGLSGPLWTLLGEHGRWLARLNPAWNRHDPATPPDSLRLTRLRREMVEAHAADPEATSAEMLSRWPRLKADERRAMLGAAASSLHRADVPLLELAMTDKLPDLRRQARLLQGHLPGTLAVQTRAALQAAVKLDKQGKLQFLVVEVPAALLDPAPRNPIIHTPSPEDDLMLLIAATPIEELVELFGRADARIVPLMMDDDRLRGAFHGPVAGGARLTILAELSRSHGPSLTAVWPQARRRERFWEAVTELLSQKARVSERTRVAQELLGNLDDPFTSAGEGVAPAQKPGLLGRLKQLVQPKGAQGDEITRLHTLFAHLLNDLATSLSHDQAAHLSLLSELVLHLDPLQGLPELLSALPPAKLKKTPSKADLDRQEYQDHMRQHLEQRYAEFVQVFELRRQVVHLLADLK